MERTAVISSNIASVGYDEPTLTLEVAFRNGSVYQYFSVPKHEFEALLSASSVGSYFSSAIRGSYPYARA